MTYGAAVYVALWQAWGRRFDSLFQQKNFLHSYQIRFIFFCFCHKILIFGTSNELFRVKSFVVCVWSPEDSEKKFFFFFDTSIIMRILQEISSLRLSGRIKYFFYSCVDETHAFIHHYYITDFTYFITSFFFASVLSFPLIKNIKNTHYDLHSIDLIAGFINFRKP